MRYDGAPGWYPLHVQYFDLNVGASRFRVYVNGQAVDEWTASDHTLVRNSKIDASSSARRTIEGIALRKGDEIRIQGIPDGGGGGARLHGDPAVGYSWRFNSASADWISVFDGSPLRASW